MSTNRKIKQNRRDRLWLAASQDPARLMQRSLARVRRGAQLMSADELDAAVRFCMRVDGYAQTTDEVCELDILHREIMRRSRSIGPKSATAAP